MIGGGSRSAGSVRLQPLPPYDISIEQGATYRTTLTLTGRDLTGYTARMQVRASVASPAVLLELTSSPAAGITITLGPPGVIDIVITAAQTAAMTWWVGFYDLELTWPNGDVERLLKSTVTVDPEVTR
ncbi:hypothetical protein ACIBG7_26935 [Nonomuraea sp. NPDC050328]|uniref:hypothetical protein n=1 Tax=Nonomuraea sp. NPDC050328 TaxID=3364361 RepID=UPI00378FEE05